ncbi:MAG: ferredoxin [Methanobacteriales archaeon Met13]
MSVTTKKSYRPLREIEVENEIDDLKCKECVDWPCLESCPVDALHEIKPDNHIEIDDKCIGCVLCREACPYDAIKLKRTLSEPISEPVPTINPKLCLNCGACVGACKTSAIQLVSSGGEEVHSEIDENICVKCGYCARVCPAEAIKYGKILPRSMVGGKSAVINQSKCIGCMTCTRVCPSQVAINVGKMNKLPYINPSYCARCEECMNVCLSNAIKYLRRGRGYEVYRKNKIMDIVSQILEKDSKTLAREAAKINFILKKIAREVIYSHHEDEFQEDVTEQVKESLKTLVNAEVEIKDISEIIEATNSQRKIMVREDDCIGCGSCISQCPVECIELEMPSPAHIGEKCVYCGQCVETCPLKAINLKEELFQAKEGKIVFMRREVTGPSSGEVVINPLACQRCGVCVNKCPVDALRQGDGQVIVYQDNCIFCGECQAICPTRAVALHEN